jgi:F-type H+-transporting ATPase subunit delta
MAKLISRTYGDALFELALEESRNIGSQGDSVQPLEDGNRMEELYEEVCALVKILSENGDFTRLMNHPKLTKEEKEELMVSIFEGRLSKELVGFLRIIILNDRYAEIDHILDYFIERVKEYKGIGVAFVSTPTELSPEQKKAVEEKLLATTGYRSMEMNYETDESLIGGMVIRIGDRVVDSSIKTKLETLKKSLLSVQISYTH